MGSLIECSRTLKVCASAPLPLFFFFSIILCTAEPAAVRIWPLAIRITQARLGLLAASSPGPCPPLLFPCVFSRFNFQGGGGWLSLALVTMASCSDLETFVRRHKLSPRLLGSLSQRAIQDAPGLAGTEPVSPKGHCWRLQSVEEGGPADRARIGVGGVSRLSRSQ
ncbi:uncharacterized protein BDZ83DRAFT_272484 [Colletotrichum acutatum]|uniref:Uncharacterized protein n=1 Tax=Glomerella acutata TaxID=27357 RepID=A0AAD8UKT9_GLOAC|nr:uncharacterized protein BDZ83DRAFT_272484 [Colletotrichum acutatum]KAK1726137.1 hypothetical protein BDZ83DRAFT_272484 [Colletotrichum acutatum]